MLPTFRRTGVLLLLTFSPSSNDVLVARVDVLATKAIDKRVGGVTLPAARGELPGSLPPDVVWRGTSMNVSQRLSGNAFRRGRTV